MVRDVMREKAWANEKYGPELRARLESLEQHEAFRALLQERGISYAAWLQGKVREELEQAKK